MRRPTRSLGGLLTAAALAVGCSGPKLPPTPRVSVRGRSTVPNLLAYTLYLSTQTDSACAVGWITDRTLCSMLVGYAVGTPFAHIQTYDSALDRARSRGTSVSDNAYALLKVNALYILAVIDTSAITVRPTCSSGGSRFVVTNASYRAVAVSYRVNGGPAKSIKLPGISSDYQRAGVSGAIHSSQTAARLDVYFRDRLVASAQC